MLIVAIIGWLLALGAGVFAWQLRGRLAAAEAERALMLERARVVLGEAEAKVKRIREERERERPFVAEPVLKDLLEIIDNLDRAIAAGEGGHGVAMIHRQSLDLLRRHGAERITSLEQPFDPNAHEAVATTPDAGPPHRVLTELSAGYRLHGRLLRPARVVVAVEGAAAPSDAATGAAAAPSDAAPEAAPEPATPEATPDPQAPPAQPGQTP